MIWILRIFFTLVVVAMLAVTTWASRFQAVWAIPWETWTHPWFIATLFDAYFGFLTFFCWVAYKERSWVARILWLVAILLLGNIAMASYVLIHLWRLPSNASMRDLLLRRGFSGDEPSAA
jgi:hypothetical protein